jgi:phenylpyruvate tautomerase PptA (4-oxalocrotonate tautomerase family)
MSSYACTCAVGLLRPDQKEAIVRSITRIHHEETGASELAVQVVFHELAPRDHWVGGTPAPAGHLWIRGDILAGRSGEQKARMLERLMEEIAKHAAVGRESVWVYLCDIPATNIASHGALLTAKLAKD